MNRRNRPTFVPIFVFVLAQVAWVTLLALWIYWFVTNYLIFTEVGNRLSIQIDIRSINIAALVSGVVLLIGISFALSLIFRYFARQASVTKSYDTFIANITHELKSPLASIRLYLETLQTRDVPDAKRTEFYRTMIKDAERLRRLIDSILEVSGLEAQQHLFDYQVHEAEPLVREVTNEAIDQLGLQEGTVSVEGSPDCRILVSRDAMRTVVVNLIDNAVKYTTEAPKINVRLSRKDSWFTVAVTDNGIGISAKDQKSVFGKFHRVESAASPSVKGTGLGLYWVREIVRRHCGRVEVRSRGLGTGTTFVVWLPEYTGKADKRLRPIYRHLRGGNDEFI